MLIMSHRAVGTLAVDVHGRIAWNDVCSSMSMHSEGSVNLPLSDVIV